MGQIIWNFPKELDNEPPVYGITRPSQTYNPITINFEHLALLIQDAWRADKWIDKLTIWVRPTGWRPNGFEEKYPIIKIKDPYNFEKYNPPISKGLFIWSNIQFFVFAFFVFYAIQNISLIGMDGMICLVIYVFVQVFSATELMNRNKWATLYSCISTLICSGIYFFDNSWFCIDRFSDLFPFLFIIYFLLQPFMAYSFNKKS